MEIIKLAGKEAVGRIAEQFYEVVLCRPMIQTRRC
ncbi:hypothetical protein MTR67_019905 [Solanum verrucosum]|uniref:Uncharacterized protein n=1 Tax=Solanum verrucosum TaxID=315347 RepID=A0AAF0QST5_SOLVR|nr:hypothetical protein MTR67_019905 [Solanum verrucosum]